MRRPVFTAVMTKTADYVLDGPVYF